HLEKIADFRQCCVTSVNKNEAFWRKQLELKSPRDSATPARAVPFETGDVETVKQLNALSAKVLEKYLIPGADFWAEFITLQNQKGHMCRATALENNDTAMLAEDNDVILKVLHKGALDEVLSDPEKSQKFLEKLSDATVADINDPSKKTSAVGIAKEKGHQAALEAYEVAIGAVKERIQTLQQSRKRALPIRSPSISEHEEPKRLEDEALSEEHKAHILSFTTQEPVWAKKVGEDLRGKIYPCGYLGEEAEGAGQKVVILEIEPAPVTGSKRGASSSTAAPSSAAPATVDAGRIVLVSWDRLSKATQNTIEGKFQIKKQLRQQNQSNQTPPPLASIRVQETEAEKKIRQEKAGQEPTKKKSKKGR
ncbi:MAG: hypothetical protein V4568_00825, partial [Pseudomonadota bacterium]